MAKPSSVNGIYGAHLFGVQGLNIPGNAATDFQARVELMLINKLIELCVNRFKWHGLPSTVNPRYLELSLFYQGLAMFFDDPDYGKLALAATGTRPNMYGDPQHFRVTGQGGYASRTVTADDGVPIWANYLRTAELETVLIYAKRLATLDVTINVNTSNARQPRIVYSSENQRLTMANLSRQIDVGLPTLKVDSDMNALEDKFGVLDMGVDADLFDKLGIARSRIWNECMSLLGIKNGNQEKKERQIVSEIEANDEQIGYMRAVNLNARQQAAREINRRWPMLHVSVDYDEDVYEGVPEDDLTIDAAPDNGGNEE